jgi:hypothetical protein
VENNSLSIRRLIETRQATAFTNHMNIMTTLESMQALEHARTHNIDERLLQIQYGIQGIGPESLRAFQSLAPEMNELLEASQFKTVRRINTVEEAVLQSIKRLGRRDESRPNHSKRIVRKTSRNQQTLAERRQQAYKRLTNSVQDLTSQVQRLVPPSGRQQMFDMEAASNTILKGLQTHGETFQECRSLLIASNEQQGGHILQDIFMLGDQRSSSPNSPKSQLELATIAAGRAPRLGSRLLRLVHAIAGSIQAIGSATMIINSLPLPQVSGHLTRNFNNAVSMSILYL